MSHINNYQSPTSWTDFGMDWTNPNPNDAHYLDALWLSFIEKSLAVPMPYISDYLTYFSSDKLLRYYKSTAIGYEGSLALHQGIMYYLLQQNRWFLNPVQPLNLFQVEGYGKYIHANNSMLTNTIVEWQDIYNTINRYNICDILNLDTILEPNKDYLNNKEWLKQSYKILNTFKIRKCLSNEPLQGYTLNSKKRTIYTNSPYYSPDNNDTTIEKNYPDTSYSNFTLSRASKQLVSGYYYYTNEERENTNIHYFYIPLKYKILGYISYWNPIPRSDDTKYDVFKSNYVDYAGWWYVENLNPEFKIGLNSIEYKIGDVTQLLPYPNPDDDQPWTNTSSQEVQNFLLEFDFNFKDDSVFE